jgi:hypothetical protein
MILNFEETCVKTEVEREKKKLTNTKLELKTPRAPPGREWVVETYLTTPKKLVVNGGGVLDVRLLCTH